MDIYEAHTKLKNKEVSSTELVKETLVRAKEANNNTFISLLEDGALEQAALIDKSISSKGPKTYLEGIPYSLKDLFLTKGIRTTAGSKILYNYIPAYDGYISSSLKEAGGILIGKVGCDEFGMGSTNENTPFGVVKNPLNPNFVAGGSSGGSAASVSEGSSFYSMGTDTGGSVRQPANFCGLTGLKPTYGRVSRYGQIAYASSLDQSSPLAKTSLDIACIMESITTKDHRDSTNAPLDPLKVAEAVAKTKGDWLKGKKVGYSSYFIDSCDDDVKAELNKALKLLKDNGCELIDVNLENLKYCVSAYYIIATSEASSNLARFDGIHYGFRKSHKGNINDTYIKSRTEGFGDEVKRRVLLGTFSLSSGYYDAYYSKASKIRRLIADDFKNAFSKCDVVFSPVCASTAFSIGEGTKDTFKMYMNDLYTIPVNLAGLPGLALPYGKGKNGMPTGFQLISKAFSEESLLKFGKAFEEVSK